MFEKFGEFDTYEELNRAAAAQKAEGDEEALYALAAENGIDREDVEDYLDGAVDELATVTAAAVGKVTVEADSLHMKGVLMDWADELKMMCCTDPEIASAVRRKGKSLAGYIAKLASDGYKNRAEVDRSIVALCSKEIRDIVGSHAFAIGVPDRASRRKIVERYYFGGQEDESI